MINSFYPKDMNYEFNEIQKQYNTARKRLGNWFYNYFRNRDSQLCLAIGMTFSNGEWSYERII